MRGGGPDSFGSFLACGVGWAVGEDVSPTQSPKLTSPIGIPIDNYSTTIVDIAQVILEAFFMARYICYERWILPAFPS
jgi:hypothetical protein